MEFVFEASIFILKINLIFLGKSQARQRLRSVLLNSENETKMPKTVSFALVPFDAIQLWVEKNTKFSQCFFTAQYKRDKTSKFSWQAKNVINFFTLKYKTLIKHIHILESAGLIYTSTKMYTHSK